MNVRKKINEEILKRVKRDCANLTVKNPSPDGFADPDAQVREVTFNWVIDRENISFRYDCTDIADWFNEPDAKNRTLGVRVQAQIAEMLQIDVSLVDLVRATTASDTIELRGSIALSDLKKRYDITDEMIEAAEVKAAEVKASTTKEKSFFNSFCCLFTSCCDDDNEAQSSARHDQSGPAYIRMDRM